MGLQEEIDVMRDEVRTDSYAMSIGELISLYDRTPKEIDIHPEFQRFYRWGEFQKARFIESILLGIPIPPIFVSQRPDGVWDVIDGLQRLSTIYELLGILKDEAGRLTPPLVLQKTKYLPSLAGKKWDDPDNPENALTPAQRLLLKRAKLQVSIILSESSEATKYELFQRLNTGGSQLTSQEIRNCILVQINRDMYSWMRDLSKYEAFRECTLLTERALEEQYDLDLVLRFLVFRTIDEESLTNIGDLNDFLRERMIEMAGSLQFDYAGEERAFKQTFDILYRSIGENSFRKYDPGKGDFVGGFLVTPFEVIALGIGYNYERIYNTEVDIVEIVKRFWTEEPRQIRAGSGVTASRRLPTTIPFGRQLFA